MKPGDLIKYRKDAFQFPLVNHEVGMVIAVNDDRIPLNNDDVYMTVLWPSGRCMHSYVDAMDLEIIQRILIHI
jgi:hypothetical protein